jgi:CDP-glucose 4,6-dehydratase
MNKQRAVDFPNTLGSVFHQKRVWISGHTGFKGSWLTQWLLNLGADVHGYALAPDTTPALFDQLGLAARMRHEIGEIRDAPSVEKSVRSFRPDFVFHLAAQPLVRRSYRLPLETYETNVMGTAYLLEAARAYAESGEAPQCLPVVIVTTDKVYENLETGRSYSETDRLGGHDPYSSSKAVAEMIVDSYRKSFFQKGPVRLATARAGNVIGGGDWADDRIVPDCIRALSADRSIPVRNKASTRPWQHVLEPLSGYLWLAACLAKPGLARNSDRLVEAFNFGPPLASNRTVADVVQEIMKHWPGTWEDKSDPAALHEANLLNLATDKAAQILQWSSVWAFEKTIQATVEWYQKARDQNVQDLTNSQIAEYAAGAGRAGLPWAQNQPQS